MRNKKLTWALLSSVLVIILGLIGYKLSEKNKSRTINNGQKQEASSTTNGAPETNQDNNKTTKQANTKIFTDSGYYEIKYPDNWSVKTGTQAAPTDTFLNNDKPVITILSYLKGYTEKDPKALIDELDMEVNNEYATRQTITDTDGINKTRVRTQHNGRTYVITLEDPSYIEQFNSMLPTFKFTK